MDIRDFYFQNIKEDEYHYQFYSAVEKVNMVYNVFEGEKETNNFEFTVFDAEEAIVKFKELCQPEVTFDKEKRCWFYLITYYLYKLGYVIKEFPRVLARPPVNPDDFVHYNIRERIITQGKDDNGTVRYATRRALVAQLTFEQQTVNIEIAESINQKFVEISNRHASFNEMSADEKLAEIVNLIENMLKKDGSYIALDYNPVCLEYVSDKVVKNYRNRLQCFRHSTDESIEERKTYSDNQKNFLIDYGIVIIKAIHSLSK